MDGLKCSEVRLSDAKSATGYFRLEAEYHTTKTAEFETSFRGKDVISKIQYGTSKYCDEDPNGYPVLRLNELNKGFIESPQKYCHIMSDEEFESLRLRKHDVVVIRTNGNPDLVGRSAVILEDTDVAFASYLFRVVPNDRINSETLVSYLNCKYGRNEINKNATKGNQTNFSPSKFRDIIIPNFGNQFQKAVSLIVMKAYHLKKDAICRYHEATEILSSIFTLNNISSVGITVKNLQETFLTTGRLDAEYYQPKYDEIIAGLHTKHTVSSLCKLHDETFLPDEKTLYPYIELSDIGRLGDINDTEPVAGGDLPSRARRKVKAGQVILSSVEGSLQSCALITEEYDNAICSTGFYVLTSDAINPETLLILFKSKPIQALLKQRCSGTILTSISKDELLTMPLPLVDEEIQRELSQKVQKSFALRRQSEEYLAYAKQAVELAIEQGEDMAMLWLNGKIKN